MVMTEINTDPEFEARQELLRGIGNKIEKMVLSNELIYLTEDDAQEIRENVNAKWEVFKEGFVWIDDGDEIKASPEKAMTGSVLAERALLVLAALGEENMTKAVIGGLEKSLVVKGGGIWKGSQRELTSENALEYAKVFLKSRYDRKNFSFGKDDGEEQKVILNRIEAMVNMIYYVLATAALQKDDPVLFQKVQTDLLLSSNFRLPLLKGQERSLNEEDRNIVLGFAQAAPIRHVVPGCLGEVMRAMAVGK